MIRIAISVEGRTEEEFVNRVLSEYLRTQEVEATPILLGGNVTVTRLAGDIARLAHSFPYVTSLVDFYGFGGKGNDTPDMLEQRVDSEVHSRIGQQAQQTEVFTYVQRYEFEALLFSEVTAFTKVPGVSQSALRQLAGIRSHFISPEDINDGFDTAPSKRIQGALPGYNKAANGYMIAAEIGLQKIRAECQRFDSWLTRLESLA